ncbi:MAG TPA: Obg family GTPase CgtA, partial [Thermomicrobiaceae bacterium]|nr:Obg family GTPase CgtA [Thermomicrobiaceae bacterium]
LAAYSDTLASRPQIVAINKMDLPETQERLPELERALLEQGYEIFPISAATHRGVTELLNQVANLLDELPPSEPVVPAQARRIYTYESTQPDFWEAERLSPHHYEVRGEKIERVTQMTNFANEEGADRFQRILAGEGISDRLEELGIQPGDVVHIADIELVWDEATLEAERQANAKTKRRRTHRQRIQDRYGGPIDVDDDQPDDDEDEEGEPPGDH